MINLEDCKRGQWLRLRNGLWAVYEGFNEKEVYPCRLTIIKTMKREIYTVNGNYFSHRLPDPLDVVEVSPFDQEKADEWVLRKEIERMWG